MKYVKRFFRGLFFIASIVTCCGIIGWLWSQYPWLSWIPVGAAVVGVIFFFGWMTEPI